MALRALMRVQGVAVAPRAAACCAARWLSARPGRSTGAPGGNNKGMSSTDKNFSLQDMLASSDDDAQAPKAVGAAKRTDRPAQRPRSAVTDTRRSSTRNDGARGDSDRSARPRETKVAPVGPAAAPAAASPVTVAAAAVSTPAVKPVDAGPQSLVLVDADGDVVPVDDAEASLMPTRVLPGQMTADEHRSATMQFVKYRRSLRSHFRDEDAELYVDALDREVGPLPAEHIDMEAMRDGKEYADGEDPLDGVKLPFNVAALRFKTQLTFTSAAGERPGDRRAVLTARVPDLRLDSVTSQYVRSIAGGHYLPRQDGIIISVDKHDNASLNKREALDTLIQLVNSSIQLAKTHGSFTKKRSFPAYSNY